MKTFLFFVLVALILGGLLLSVMVAPHVDRIVERVVRRQQAGLDDLNQTITTLEQLTAEMQAGRNVEVRLNTWRHDHDIRYRLTHTVVLMGIVGETLAALVGILALYVRKLRRDADRLRQQKKHAEARLKYAEAECANIEKQLQEFIHRPRPSKDA